MTTFVYDKRFVPFLWPNLKPVKPEHLHGDYPCLIELPTARIPQYPFIADKPLFLLPFATSSCQLPLLNREAVMDYLSKAMLMKLNKDVRARLMKLDDDTFFNTLRLSVALKRWQLPHAEDSRAYRLFGDLLTTTPQKCLATTFEMTHNRPMKAVWSSVLTFLNRVDSWDEKSSDSSDGLSDFYRTLIARSKRQLSSWRSKVVPLLTYRKVSDVHLVAAVLSLRE